MFSSRRPGARSLRVFISSADNLIGCHDFRQCCGSQDKSNYKGR